VFCGYPFLAYPEIGAWYLLHWPFYLIGIEPLSIQWELALNACIACLGMYALLRGMLRNRLAPVFGGLAYGLSGFFACHSLHVGIFCAAACFPWLLAGYQRTAASQPPLTRLDAPSNLGLGPRDHPLTLRLDAAYGNFALELWRLREYTDTIVRNRKLLMGINVSRYAALDEGAHLTGVGTLPRAYFPNAIVQASGSEESRRFLETLDPAMEAVVLGSPRPIRQDPLAAAEFHPSHFGLALSITLLAAVGVGGLASVPTAVRFHRKEP
jgi:hypothetical protein